MCFQRKRLVVFAVIMMCGASSISIADEASHRRRQQMMQRLALLKRQANSHRAQPPHRNSSHWMNGARQNALRQQRQSADAASQKAQNKSSLFIKWKGAARQGMANVMAELKLAAQRREAQKQAYDRAYKQTRARHNGLLIDMGNDANDRKSAEAYVDKSAHDSGKEAAHRKARIFDQRRAQMKKKHVQDMLKTKQ